MAYVIAASITAVKLKQNIGSMFASNPFGTGNTGEALERNNRGLGAALPVDQPRRVA